ncbi:MAG: hypothetical protein GF311_25790 [Candidatus Lokiarchaeota archaeon]|nr:hypothetical protein [Candidatus Lokiarchaeota archaeon]
MKYKENNQLPISIVIRCSDDFRVFDCINSIDEDVEVIISLTKNNRIQERLEKSKIKYYIAPKGNLSIISNLGVRISNYDKVIITDSDTIFETGCILEFFHALNKFDIVRASLIFRKDQRNVFSKIIAKAREYVYEKNLAFTPGLGINKSIIENISGFLFNSPVPWAVDADLNFRIKREGIPIKILKYAHIHHVPIKLKHDLKAAFRIGMGVCVSVKELSKLYPDSKNIKRNLKAVKKNEYYYVFKRKSLMVLFYQIIWDIFFQIGFLVQKYLNIY